MTDYKIFDRDKFTVVGSPTITDDGVASGFSDSNRIRTKDLLNFHNKTFSIKVKFKQEDWSAQCRFFTASGIALSVAQDASSWTLGRFVVFITTDSGSIASYAVSDRCITKNQYNYVKFIYDGSKYTVQHSLDDKIYTTVYTLASTESPVNTDRLIDIGSAISDVAYVNYIGQIDLKSFSITVDGVEVFSGSHNGTLTDKLVYLNDTKQIIKSAIEAKGIEVPTATPFRQYADKISEISVSSEPTLNIEPYEATTDRNYAVINKNLLLVTSNCKAYVSNKNFDFSIPFEINLCISLYDYGNNRILGGLSDSFGIAYHDSNKITLFGQTSNGNFNNPIINISRSNSYMPTNLIFGWDGSQYYIKTNYTTTSNEYTVVCWTKDDNTALAFEGIPFRNEKLYIANHPTADLSSTNNWYDLSNTKFTSLDPNNNWVAYG